MSTITLLVILCGDDDLNQLDNDKMFAADHTKLLKAEDLHSTTMAFCFVGCELPASKNSV